MGVHRTGIAGGVSLPVMGFGYLDFVFPGYEVGSAGWAGHVSSVYDQAHVYPFGYAGCTSAVRRASHHKCKQVADRFNIFVHGALLSFQDTIGVQGVASFKVDCKIDYSGGIAQRAMGRKAPMRQAINQITMQIRKSIPPGHAWWTDISHKHEPDFAGTSIV
jgi:hypothetical protein